MGGYLKKFILVVVIAGLLSACGGPSSEDDAAIEWLHLPFDGSLHNNGYAATQGEVFAGEIEYRPGVMGEALFTQGDGSWVEIKADPPILPGNTIEIGFNFRREDWKNPYKSGSGVQTLVSFSGRDEKRIWHLSFSYRPGDRASSLAIAFKDENGRFRRMKSKPGSVGLGWHKVGLSIDRESGETRLYLDDVLVDSGDFIPQVMNVGVRKIKLGTWYKQNQAYRGLIDELVMKGPPAD